MFGLLTSYYYKDKEKIDPKDDDDDGRERNPLAQIITEGLVILRSDRLAEHKGTYNSHSIIMKPFRYVGSVAG